MTTSINGTTGVTFPDLSVQPIAAGAYTFGFKNRIINGGMQIAQRGTSATITAGSTIAAGYSTVDRFYVYCTGANVTAAQVAGSGSTKNRLQITGAASVTAIGIGQRIEQLNSYDMAGSTATLSVDISNSLLTTVTWTASYATTTADTFGTLASPTVTQIATGTFTVTSSLTRYSTQISIPAAATTGIQIVFTVGAQTSGTWVIGNIQLEESPTATSFDVRPYTTELQLCQRYYFKISDQSSYATFTCGSTTIAQGVVNFQTTMRIAPTALEQSGTASHYALWGGSAVACSSVPTWQGSSTSAGVVRATVASGLTTGQARDFIANNASAYLAWSAEL